MSESRSEPESRSEDNGSQIIQTVGALAAGAYSTIFGKALVNSYPAGKLPPGRAEFKRELDRCAISPNSRFYKMQLNGQNCAQSYLRQPLGPHARHGFLLQVKTHAALDQEHSERGISPDSLQAKREHLEVEAVEHPTISGRFEKDGFISGQIAHTLFGGPLAQVRASLYRPYSETREPGEITMNAPY